jgi:predicted sulfurtransferase
MSSSSHSAIVLFYKYFVPGETPSFFHHHVDHYVDQLVQFQRDLCHKLELKGRLLVAPEGINGTLSGATASVIQEYIREMKNWNIRNDCPLPPEAAAAAGQGGGVNAAAADAADASAAIAENKTDAARLFAQVDWKESSVHDDDDDNDDPLEPFPDLKISIVKEIVSTGGLVRAEEVTTKGGRHLTPQEFHQVLVDDSTTDTGTGTGTNTGTTTTGTKPVVLVDVRNTFEHDIGHFVHPNSGLAAMNPEMVTFSSFDTNFCAKYANELKDKKVLMYCTGGIR